MKRRGEEPRHIHRYNRPSYTCGCCGLEFPTQSLLDKHYEDEHWKGFNLGPRDNEGL